MNAPPKTELKLPPSAVELRRARARKLAIRFAVGVGLPTLVAIVYLGFIASPQYDATAVVAVESSQDHQTGESGKDADARHQRDARMLRDYIRSRAMMAQLDLGHYRSGDVDWWSRLGGGSEEAFDYYQDKVVVAAEPASSVLHVRVRAFSAEAARRFADAIVAGATTWIASESEAARRQLIEPAEAEVVRAKERLIAARTALVQSNAGAAGATPDPINDPLVVEHELAQKQLDEAVEALAGARLAAAAAARRLVVIAAPATPTEASQPRVGWGVATVFVTAAVLVAVLSLLGAAVREHANL